MTLTQKWQVRYSGPITNSVDAGVVSAIAPDGNVVIAGTSAYATNYADIYLVKYFAATGVVMWQQRSHGRTNKNDKVFGMVMANFDDFAVVPDRFHDGGDVVVVEGRAVGTTKSGARLDAPACWVVINPEEMLTDFCTFRTS